MIFSFSSFVVSDDDNLCKIVVSKLSSIVVLLIIKDEIGLYKTTEMIIAKTKLTNLKATFINPFLYPINVVNAIINNIIISIK